MDDIESQSGNNDKQVSLSENKAALSSSCGSSEDDEIYLADYFRVLIKYRWMIFLICTVAVVGAVIVSLLLPPIYSATVSVVPPIEMLQKESGLASSLGIGKSSLISSAIGGGGGIAGLYVGILESRAVADAIIDRHDLMNASKETKYRSDVREALRGNTVIKASDESIVRITVKDSDPNRAAAIANSYVEELDRRNKRLYASQATSKRIFLANRLKEIEERLSRIEDIPAREARTQEMLFELLTREYEITKIEEAKSMPTVQVLDKAIVPEKKSAPRRRRIVMLSGITALLAAVFAVFAREYFAKANTSFSGGAVEAENV